MSVKKIFTVLLSFFILLSFFSCKAEENTFFDGDFTARLCYRRLGVEYTVDYERTASGEKAKIVSPESLAGLTAKRDENGITLSLDSLELSSVAEDIFTPFELLREDSGAVVTAENGIPKTVCGTIDNEEFEIRILSFDSERTAK